MQEWTGCPAFDRSNFDRIGWSGELEAGFLPKCPAHLRGIIGDPTDPEPDVLTDDRHGISDDPASAGRKVGDDDRRFDAFAVDQNTRGVRVDARRPLDWPWFLHAIFLTQIAITSQY